MANFHFRDIPEPLYNQLRARAQKAGRSVNKELLSIVEKELARPTPEVLVRRLHELRKTIPPLPPGAPKPEDLIREDRDADHGRGY